MKALNHLYTSISILLVIFCFNDFGLSQSLGPNSASARIEHDGAYFNVSVQYELDHVTLEEQFKTQIKVKHVIVHSVDYKGVGYNSTKNRGDISFPYTLYSGVWVKTELREAVANQGYETMVKDVYCTFPTVFLFTYDGYKSASSDQRRKAQQEWRSRSTASNISIKDIDGTEISDILYEIKNTLRKEEQEKEARSTYDNYMNEGARHEANGDYDAAMSAYRRASNVDVDNNRADDKLNAVQNQKMEFEAQQEQIQNDYEDHMSEGKRLMAQGDFEAAKAHFEKAAELDVDNEEAIDMVEEAIEAEDLAQAEEKEKEEEDNDGDDEDEDEDEDEDKDEDEDEEDDGRYDENGNILVRADPCAYLADWQERYRNATLPSTRASAKEQVNKYKRMCDQERLKRAAAGNGVMPGTKEMSDQYDPKRQEYNKKKQEFEEKQRQQRVNNELTRQNTEAAAQMGAAAILVHLMIGQQIYNNIGGVLTRNRSFKGSGDHHHVEAGYGGSFIPYNNAGDFSITIDLGVKYRYDLFYGEYGNFGIYGSALGGHSLQALRWDIGAGLESSFGAGFMKLSTNLRFNRRVISFSEWIDAASDYETKAMWKYARFELGPRFSWNNQSRHIEMLFGFNTFARNALNHSSFRLNFQANNKIKFHLEYARLSGMANSYSQINEQTLPYFEFGVYRTWNTFKKGSFDHSYDELVTAQRNNNWYFSILNPIISWGEIRNGSTRVETTPNYAINLATVEKEFSLGYNLSMTAGAGLTVGRGYTGEINNSNKFFDDFYDGPQTELKSTMKTRSRAEIDLPFGVNYYIPAGSTDRFWFGFQFQPSFNLGSTLRTHVGYNNTSADPIELVNFTKSSNINTKLGVGFDLSGDAQKVYRLGLYHVWTSGFLEDDYDNTLRGLHIKFAFGI